MIIFVILKRKLKLKDDVKILLETVEQTNEKYKSKDLVQVLVGNVNALISSHKTDAQDFFGIGKDKDKRYWMALIRQVLVAGYLKKDIETYGVLRLQ